MAPRFGGHPKGGLEFLTDGFSRDNYLCDFQLGKVYRGKSSINEPLLVKVWDRDEIDGYPIWREDKDARMRDESCLTYDDRIQFHPNMIEISAIAWSDFTPTMVYKIDALDTLDNLMDKDNFSWLHRVKAALGIASFIKCMHGCRPLAYLIRNISAAHIILDQDYNAKLYDFSMISGGILADKTELLNQHLQGCYGYVDPDYVSRGIWSKKCDVFAFGVVLIGLISKRVQTETNNQTSHEPFLYEWAHNESQKQSHGHKLVQSKFSLVHKTLEVQPFYWSRDGVALSKLAMLCVDYNPKKRPTMKQIFHAIWELLVVQKNAGILSLRNMKTVERLSISELRRSMIKNLKVAIDLKEKASKTLYKYLAKKDKLISASKDWKYVAPSRLSYEDIKCYTNGFCETNFINIYPFGKLYHGSIDSRKVTVKTWEDVETYYIEEGDNEIRLREELVLLQHPKFVSHPHIVKMIGYCYENEKLSAVYNLESLDSLYNLIPKDSFTWHKRIIFILELAGLLKYLLRRNPPHMPYFLRNIVSHAILVDMHYMPKLFDFGLLLGGIMTDQKDYRIRHIYTWGYYGDPYTNCHEYYTDVSDIYSLGMVMLNLITKICYTGTDVEFDDWIRNEYERAKIKSNQHLKSFSVVDNNFCHESGFHPCDGLQVTKLAMQCIHEDYSKRPTVNQIIKRLKKLKVMKMGINK